MVKYYCQILKNVNSYGDYGVTPIHLASENGHEEVVRCLVNHLPKGSTAPKGLYGQTPLQYAARKGHLEIVKILAPTMTKEEILHKVRIKKDSVDITALDFAKHSGHDEIVEYLLRTNEKLNFRSKRAKKSKTLIINQL